MCWETQKYRKQYCYDTAFTGLMVSQFIDRQASPPRFQQQQRQGGPAVPTWHTRWLTGWLKRPDLQDYLQTCSPSVWLRGQSSFTFDKQAEVEILSSSQLNKCS